MFILRKLLLHSFHAEYQYVATVARFYLSLSDGQKNEKCKSGWIVIFVMVKTEYSDLG